jgi:hypothetical protein
LNVALLDLSRRRVIYDQDHIGELDWPAMKAAMAEADPGTIDVKSLADRQHNAAFFVTEVARRIDPAESTPPARVLIVLSGSVAFDSGEDLRPIHIKPAPDCRVFYFRFHAVQPRLAHSPFPEGGRRHRLDTSIPMEVHRQQMPDQLASTLKPLAPRVVDIYQPEQFRKALAAMLAEVGRL